MFVSSNSFKQLAYQSHHNSTNTTALSYPSYVGFFFLSASSFLCGTSFIPIKQFETGDGMFFNLILCLGVWSVGAVVNVIRNFPKFYFLPMLGGFLWTNGLSVTVPIIKTIGIGVGTLLWCSISLITGWTTARFGLFGLEPEVPRKQVFNYIGVALTLISIFLYLFVKSDAKTKRSKPKMLLNDDETSIQEPNSSNASRYINKERLFGVSLAIFAGLMYGQCYTPVIYASDNYKDASKNDMDYLFSYYTGCLLTALLYFIVYCAVKRNNPQVFSRIFLPSLVSGWMCGLSTVSYYLSISALDQVVSFPISNSLPPIIASCWAIFYKEIKGVKNFAFLLTGFAAAIAGSIFSGFSF